jgi:hypothetical protein
MEDTAESSHFNNEQEVNLYLLDSPNLILFTLLKRMDDYPAHITI